MSTLYMFHVKRDGVIIDYSFDSKEKMEAYIQLISQSGKDFSFDIDELIIDDSVVLQ